VAELTVARLRRGLLALAAAATAGTAVELAMLRHWQSAAQLTPWAALAALTTGILVLVRRPSARGVQAARVLAAVVLIAAVLGVVVHVMANYDAGPLDFRYAARWPTMTGPARWWAALTESVGPAPTLAPGVLAQAALCLLLATLHHPAAQERRLIHASATT
jgi:hypothetical protein